MFNIVSKVVLGHSSHRLGSGHGGSTHHDPPTDHSFDAEGCIHTSIDPSTSVGHG